MVDVTNFAQMLLPFVLLGQGIWFLINGIAEEKKCAQNKEKEVEKKKLTYNKSVSARIKSPGFNSGLFNIR